MATMHAVRQMQKRMRAIRNPNPEFAYVAYQGRQYLFKPFDLVNGRPTEEGELAAWEHINNDPRASNPQYIMGSIRLSDEPWGRIAGFQLDNKFEPY